MPALLTYRLLSLSFLNTLDGLARNDRKDADRFKDARKRLSVLPLGPPRLHGNRLSIDRGRTANS